MYGVRSGHRQGSDSTAVLDCGRFPGLRPMPTVKAWWKLRQILRFSFKGWSCLRERLVMTKITAAELALAASDLKAGSATIPCLQQVKQFLSSDVIAARFDGKKKVYRWKREA